ncbi:MAG TPA: hypothetical protein DDY37_03620 [Legionella sp.]|nr:hypothetical protein [Legionella sp.]
MIDRTGNSILYYTLQQDEQHERFRHYPKGDRIDRTSGAQYFYHCHRENFDSTEHGHFHCFLRYKHIPKYIKPARIADWDKYIDNPMTHIVAIGMNNLGLPIRLFTVNRWVSSEIWYDAKHAQKLINKYQMTLTDNPYWQVLDQWVNAMIRLFAPQIAWLYTERDKAVLAHFKTNTNEPVYENKAIEELSSINIDLNEQIHWIMNAP